MEDFLDEINVDQTYSNNFDFTIGCLPHTVFSIQRVNIPGVSVNETSISTPASTAKLNLPGNVMQFEPIQVNFMIDDEFDNYIEIWNWIVQHGGPEDVFQTRRKTSDATLFVTSNHLIPSLLVKFKEVHPVSLGDISFETTVTSAVPLVCEASFRYDTYTIEKII